jgi:hypothetical protein
MSANKLRSSRVLPGRSTVAVETTLQTVTLSSPFASHPALASAGVDPSGARVWATLHLHGLFCAFSVVLVVSMLLTFYSVVSLAVSQGELHQQALVTQSRAIWRCKLLSSVSARQNCLLAIPKPLDSGNRTIAQVSQ